MCQYDVRFIYQRDTKTGSSNGYFLGMFILTV